MLTVDGETRRNMHVSRFKLMRTISRASNRSFGQNLYMRVKITQVWKERGRWPFASRETNRASGIVVTDTCAKIGPISTIHVSIYLPPYVYTHAAAKYSLEYVNVPLTSSDIEISGQIAFRSTFALNAISRSTVKSVSRMNRLVTGLDSV